MTILPEDSQPPPQTESQASDLPEILIQADRFTLGKQGELRGTLRLLDDSQLPTGIDHAGNFSNLRVREDFARLLARSQEVPREYALEIINQKLVEVRQEWDRQAQERENRAETELGVSVQEFTGMQEMAAPLLEDPAILHKAIHVVEDLGVVGERRNTGIIRLSIRSRALPRPANVEVNSPSSAGKTHVVVVTLRLEHESAYYEMTAGSERSLIYLNEPIDHRVLYIQEPEGLMEGVGAAVLKSLSWEGRLKYDTVIKDENGEFVGQHIEKDGPTGLIVTTTRPLDEQISNRMVRIEINTGQDQTRRILQVIAESMNGRQAAPDLGPWHAVSALLGMPADVEIPFGKYLAERVGVTTLRVRRDFTQLLTFIAASTIEHRYQRILSPEHRVIATIADYGHVHALLADVFASAQAEGITEADWDMVTALSELLEVIDGGSAGNSVTQSQLRQHLGLSKSSAQYRVRRLLDLGHLVNKADKIGPGRPMELALGAPLPDRPDPLPSPCDLGEYLYASGRLDLIQPWVDPVTGQGHDCRTHLGISGDEFSYSCPKCSELFDPPKAGPIAEQPAFISAELSDSPPSLDSRVQESSMVAGLSDSATGLISGADEEFKDLQKGQEENANLCRQCGREVSAYDVAIYEEFGVICLECDDVAETS